MKETPKTSADEILDTLSATYQESIYKESAVHPAEELTPEDAALVERDDEAEAYEERPSTIPEKITHKHVHKLMGDDVWVLGREKLEGKNIMAVREEVRRRLKEKSAVRECIMNHITAEAQSSPVNIDDDVDIIPSWQKCFRTSPNNLGLTL